MPNLNTLVLAILIMGGVFTAGRHQAYLEQQAEIARIEAERAVEVAKAADQLHKDKLDAQQKINQLRADVASGAQRLSIRASCSATVAGGDPEARAELDPKTADDLIAITADGDQAIIELNSCIDLYNKFTK
jgi:phosphosulfolactate synthase (CoM biosynthesis protein A)